MRLLSLLIWLYLCSRMAGSGSPARCCRAGGGSAPPRRPSVAIVVPARDEAPLIAATLRSLLAQDYAGPFRVILVDDGSTDGTGAIARATRRPAADRDQRRGPRPPGWSGKLWAVPRASRRPARRTSSC